MEASRWDPNASIVCPYDDTHVLSVKRFQRHLVKCRQNHPEKDFVTCPFNARHMFLRSDLRKHLSHCADRVTLDADIQREEDPETGEMLRLKGKTDMPKHPENIPNSTEDWDDEIEENLITKYAYQEEYIKLQGIMGRHIEEAPILRRPNLPIVNEPRLPLLNRPANLSEGGQHVTSLRRPNLTLTDTNSETPSGNSCIAATSIEKKNENEKKNESNLLLITNLATVDVDSDKEVQSTMSATSAATYVDMGNSSRCSPSASSNTTVYARLRGSKRDTKEDTIYTSNNLSDKISPRLCETTATAIATNEAVCNEKLSERVETNSARSETGKPGSQTSSETRKPGSQTSCQTSKPDSQTSSQTSKPGCQTSSHDEQTTTTTTTTTTTDNNKRAGGVAGSSNAHGISRGRLLQTFEGSAFTLVVPKETTVVNGKTAVNGKTEVNSKTAFGRGKMNGVILKNKPIGRDISEDVKVVGFGRGSLKEAALNFQRM